MLKHVKQIDLFGRRAELSMNGQKSHKTWCGTFCTMFIFIACMISSIYYASEFFRRKNPQYIYSEVYDSIYNVYQDTEIIEPFQEIKIGSKNFFAMMGFQNAEYDLNNYDIEFTILSKEVIITQFQGVNCNNVEYFKDLLNDITITKKDNFKVVKENPEKFVCLGSKQSDLLPFVYEEQSRVEVRLRCIDTISCKNITGQKLVILSADYLLIPQDFYNPLTLYIMDHYVVLDEKYLTFIDVQLQKIRISTDYGYIVENNRYFEQVTFRDFKRYNQLRDTSQLQDPLILINIIPFSKRQIYDRTYPKVITLIGIVGGLLKSLMVVGHFCTKPFSKLSMRSDLVNQLFTFEIISEKKPGNTHEIDQGGQNEEEDEDENGNKKFVPRSKSMTFSKFKQGDKANKLQKLKTQVKENEQQQPISVDQLKLQVQNSEQMMSMKNTTAFTTNLFDTNNNLETPQNTIQNLKGDYQQQQQQHFLYPPHFYIQENSLTNHIDNKFDKQTQLNLQQEEFNKYSPAQRFNSTSSEVQSDDQYNGIQNTRGHFNRDSYNSNNQITVQRQQPDIQFRNKHLSGKFNNILGKKKESIILNETDMQQELEINQNLKQLRFNTMNTMEYGSQQSCNNNFIQSPSQSTPPNQIITPIFNHLDLDTATDKTNITMSTRTSLKKGALIKSFKHSQSQSEDCRSTNLEIQKELEEKNLMQRRNANFDREKKTFAKKETNRNAISANQEQQQSNDEDKNIRKQQSIKKEITKKATLQKKDSFRKKETIKNQPEQPQNEGDTQKLSSSRRIKSFFSSRTKEITNLIRFNIKQRQQQSKDQQESKGQSQFSDPFSQDQESKTEEKGGKKLENSQLFKQNTHKQFEGIINEKQEKSIVLTIVDYVKYFFKCFKDTPKVKQMKYTNKKVKKRLDIIYILEKLIEIDKLKVLLLNPDQINLFDYMPKEFVQSDLNDQDKFEIYDKNNKFATWSLLCAERSQLDKYSNACIAYHHIQQNINKTKIDKKLVQMLDPQVKRYFNKTFIQPEDIQEYRNLLSNYSHSEDEINAQLNGNNNLNYRDSQTQSFDIKHQNSNQQSLHQSQQLQYNNLLNSQQIQQNYFNFGQLPQISYNNLGASTQLSQLQSSVSPLQSLNDRSRLSHEQNSMRQDKFLSLHLPERLNNERTLSQLSQQTIFTSSPQSEAIKNSPPMSNFSDTDTLAMSILKNKRNNYISQKSKLNNLNKEYCWQAPIIEESNNMLSSEKFGESSYPKVMSKGQISPSIHAQLEEKKSQLFLSRHQSIIIKNDEQNNIRNNTPSNSMNNQQIQMQTEGEEILQTEPAFITDRLNDDVIKFENSENSSFNRGVQFMELDSPVKQGDDQHIQNQLNILTDNHQQMLNTHEDEIQSKLNNNNQYQNNYNYNNNNNNN